MHGALNGRSMTAIATSAKNSMNESTKAWMK